MDTEKEIRMIEQGSEEARLVSKAMASSTASELLAALSERPKTATELEEETGYPLPTIQYHIGNLLNAGLIQVRRVRYSEKGKPMKLYAVADTILVISPKRKAEDEIRPVLRRYGFSAVGFIATVSAAVAVCNSFRNGYAESQMFDMASGAYALVEDTLKETVPAALPVSEQSSFIMTATGAADTVTGSTIDLLVSQIDLGMLIFLIVALLILAGMMVFELVRIRRAGSDDS